MFNPNDIYVSGAADQLRACWTENVTKYDGSSFYVWEQDNLPLDDLDERTELLWEKLGHPTSALAGMQFVVSAEATTTCYPNYFTTLSSCINALPEVINYPILIEVASYGDLGSLHLSNKSFGPNGALEIVNRNMTHNAGVDTLNNTINIQSNDSNTTYGYFASGITADGPAYETDNRSAQVLGTVMLAPHSVTDMYNAKVYSTGDFIASGTGINDTRVSSTPMSVFVRNTDYANNRMTASIKSSGSYNGETIPFSESGGIATKKIVFEPFEINTTNRSNEKMDTYDVSTLNEITTTEILWGEDTAYPVTGVGHTGYGAGHVTYMNTLTDIRIDNCKGPIYIRNFHADGGTSHIADIGISITNSELVLEKCAATRFGKSGLHATNSNVKLRRGFVGYRNYGFDVSGERLNGPYDLKRTDQSPTASYLGAGIRAENSTIEIEDDSPREFFKTAEAFSYSRALNFDAYFSSAPGYNVPTAGSVPVPGSESLYCLSRNDIGIDLINSNLIGGKNETPTYDKDFSGAVWSSPTRPWQDSYQLFSELNTESGIKSRGSVIEYSGRMFLYGNHRGLDARESDISVDVLKAQYNQREGVKLESSNLTYGKDGYTSYLHKAGVTANYSTERSTYDLDTITLKENGKHIYANNSSIKPIQVSSIPDTYQSIFTSGAIGVEYGRLGTKASPSIHLVDSYADLIHPTIIRDNLTDADQPSYGDALLANDNSTVYLRGSNNYATRIIGPGTLTAQSRKAGIMADNGSNIHIQGPTVIARFAVGALADNNSNIGFSPHRDSNGTLLVSSFDLSNTSNHTMVELHASRACLVADNGSTIKMEDLGSYHPFWTSGSYASAIPITQYDYLKNSEVGASAYAGYVSGGYMQLYPNGMHTSVPVPAFSVLSPTFTDDSFHPAGVKIGQSFPGYLFDWADGTFASSGVTTGGMCVRALNNSKVDVNNVHFPAGWPNTSAAIYDFEGFEGGPACSRLHIWNIADNSIVNAKYVTVSGAHPRDSGYYGPSGTWGISGAPVNTPDTSSLSVLDYYGSDAAGENIFGKSTLENFGPFRLYFSTDPAANHLVDPVTVASGAPYQVFSQGYNWSGTLSAPGSVSAQYTSILRSDNGVLATSAFYYASSMVTSPQTIKAVLDDSGSNAFANAKHNSVGKSGLAKVVHIYYAYDAVFGGDSQVAKGTGNGLGSVNNFDLKKDN